MLSVGEKNVCSMWQDYFSNLYNSVPDNGAKGVFADACSASNDDNIACITVNEVRDAIACLKTEKSAGPIMGWLVNRSKIQVLNCGFT